MQIESLYYQSVEFFNKKGDKVNVVTPIPLYVNSFAGSVGRNNIASTIAKIESDMEEHLALWMEANPDLATKKGR